MDYLSNFLAHKNYSNVIYAVDTNLDGLFKVLKLYKPNDFLLLLLNKEKEPILNEFLIKENLKINYIDLNNVENYQNYSLVIDHVEDSATMIDIASILKPIKIVGYFDKDFDTYSLWQKLRDFCNEISLAKYSDDYKDEVLHWVKSNPIELSVVLPVYNVSKQLTKCIETLTHWDCNFVEYLFVNDGSTDNSLSVLEKWAKKDRRIKIINKENGGCASARELGLSLAKGSYVGFVDPDDFIDPLMFKKLLCRAMTGSYDICYCGYNEYYENTGESAQVEDAIYPPYTNGIIDVDFIDWLIANRRIAIWRGIYKKSFLIENNIHFHTQLKRFDDLPFKVETLARAKTVVSVNEYLYYYRLGRKGQDVAVSDSRLFVHFDIFKILDDFFKVYRSSKQLDYYYQVKIQTHCWAIGKIEKEYLGEYLDLATKDLKIPNTPKYWKNTLLKYFRKRDIKEVMKKIRIYF